jgi:pilus assembly protein Flp/PilA
MQSIQRVQQSRVVRFAADESGATAIEYAMIASLISVVIIGALLLLGESNIAMYDYISTEVGKALKSSG